MGLASPELPGSSPPKKRRSSRSGHAETCHVFMLVGQEFKQEPKHRERPHVVKGVAFKAGFPRYFPADVAGPLTLKVIRRQIDIQVGRQWRTVETGIRPPCRTEPELWREQSSRRLPARREYESRWRRPRFLPDTSIDRQLRRELCRHRFC